MYTRIVTLSPSLVNGVLARQMPGSQAIVSLSPRPRPASVDALISTLPPTELTETARRKATQKSVVSPDVLRDGLVVAVKAVACYVQVQA